MLAPWSFVRVLADKFGFAGVLLSIIVAMLWYWRGDVLMQLAFQNQQQQEYVSQLKDLNGQVGHIAAALSTHIQQTDAAEQELRAEFVRALRAQACMLGAVTTEERNRCLR